MSQANSRDLAEREDSFEDMMSQKSEKEYLKTVSPKSKVQEWLAKNSGSPESIEMSPSNFQLVKKKSDDRIGSINFSLAKRKTDNSSDFQVRKQFCNRPFQAENRQNTMDNNQILAAREQNLRHHEQELRLREQDLRNKDQDLVKTLVESLCTTNKHLLDERNKHV